jgi:hypothetical protein
MTKREFVDYVGKLCGFFERRRPSDETMDLWFDKCQRIPDDSLRWVTGELQGQESFPRNLPAATWALYHRWLEAHPEKKQRKVDRPCYTAECEDGLLFCHRHDDNNGLWHGFAFRCPCERSDAYGIPILSKSTLIEQGYVFGRLPERPPRQLQRVGNMEFAETPF